MASVVGAAVQGALVVGQAAEGDGPSMLVTFAPLLFLAAVWYFLIVMPQNKEQAAKDDMRSKLKKGDEVLLQGGLFGKVAEVADKHLEVELAKNVKVKALRTAVLQVVPPGGDVKPAENEKTA